MLSARTVRTALASVALITLCAAPPAAATGGGSGSVSLTTAGTAYAQNFDTLANSGTTNVLSLTGWYLNETGTAARNNGQYGASTGSDTAGDVYSFGAAASSERAFGTLFSGTLTPVIGAQFTNNTGVTITSLKISYTGEMWRAGVTNRNAADRLDFQLSTTATSLTTGTWADHNSLDYSSSNINTTAGPVVGNNAGNNTAVSATITGLSIGNGATFWIRWNDIDVSPGADDGLAVDDFSITPNPPPAIALSVDDVSHSEGNVLTTTYTFTVTATAGIGNVTFDIKTQDGVGPSGATAPSDYTAINLTGQTIAGGATKTFDVLVNGDTGYESNETFTVKLSNAGGGVISDDTGVGTITNDDPFVGQIGEIQGSGLASPFAGQAVRTLDNIVTGVTSNGFFMQDPDGDGNAATSDGIFVFTGAAPTVSVGDQVDVDATATEFFNLTELNSAVVTVDSSGNPLPAAVLFTEIAPGVFLPSHDQPWPSTELERFEGMRVRFENGRTTGPSNAFGEVQVVADNTRAVREPGIEYPGKPGHAVIWDGNPEIFAMDPDGCGLPDVDLPANSVIQVAEGPLSFSFGEYMLFPTTLTYTAAPLPVPVRAKNPGEMTVGSQNMLRLFDDNPSNGPDDEINCTPVYQDRLAKASDHIRNNLRSPDVLALEEVENVGVLQDLAARIALDDPSVVYAAYLLEGSDIGGIDTGFLVRDTVTVNSVTQGDATHDFLNQTLSLNGSKLHDRPPLVLDGQYVANGAPFPITVIGIHNRSLSGIDSGSTSDQNRIRQKRMEEALTIADYIQDLQTADSTRRIVLVGDFNAYEFSDGYADALGIITGDLDPNGAIQQVVPPTYILPGEVTPIASYDLVNPNFHNYTKDEPFYERYSFIFGGSAQAIDHAVASASLASFVRDLEHARGNADGPTGPTPVGCQFFSRVSDHDGEVLYVMTDFDADGTPDDNDLDDDDDGVPDVDDACPHSNPLQTTVVIDGCDTGVPDQWLPSGCSISDTLLNIANAAWNHGQYVSQATQFFQDLRKANIIDNKQKGDLTRCAAWANLP